LRGNQRDLRYTSRSRRASLSEGGDRTNLLDERELLLFCFWERGGGGGGGGGGGV
jgi:hypothetical protein